MCPPMFSSKCCQARQHLHAFLMVLPSRSTHIHTSVHLHCKCCLMSSINFPKILCLLFFLSLSLSGCIYWSFGGSNSQCKMSWISFFFFSPQWCLLNDNLRNAQCAVDSFNTEYCSCKTVTFHRNAATVLSLGVGL